MRPLQPPCSHRSIAGRPVVAAVASAGPPEGAEVVGGDDPAGFGLMAVAAAV